MDRVKDIKTVLDRLLQRVEKRLQTKDWEKEIKITYNSRDLVARLAFDDVNDKWLIGITDIETGYTEWLTFASYEDAERVIYELASNFSKA